MSSPSHAPRTLAAYDTVVLLAFVSVFVIAVFAAATMGAGASARESPAASTGGVPGSIEWPTNERGQTYGSAAKATSETDEPDLVAAVATNGKAGFCLAADLEGPVPKSPEEARSITDANLRGRKIPVYKSDGITQVGVFLVGGPRSRTRGTTSDGATITRRADSDGNIITTTKAPDGTVDKTMEAPDGTVTKMID